MNRKVLGGIVLLVIVVAVGGLALAQSQGQGVPKPTSTSRDDQPITISAKGSIVPVTQARLAFKSGGKVESVLVKEGDKVKRGQTLAKLETADIELQVKAAEDALALNEALLRQAKEGTTEADVKADEAAFEAAKERLAQSQATVEAEGVAAKASLDAAQAKLALLKNGPTAEDIRAAELQLEQAKNTLWATQLDRDGIKGTFGKDDYRGKAGDARVAAAETAVSIAEASLLKLKQGASQQDITIAEAAVTQAESQLKAKQATSESTLAAAQAAVESAQAKLAQTRARSSAAGSQQGASQAEIDVALARVEQAKTAVEQAKAPLSNAILLAPFDGQIASLQIRAGEMASPGNPAIILGDTGTFQVETSDLDEASAAKIQTGQPVDVIVNAFDNKVLKGKVSAMANYATITSTGDANYVATIALDGQDDSLRWGMTAKVDFGVEK
ncbi:MAG: efflux RND transporter periplasmic adaptor subunit [Chloroflexi bacterium]|nr:efflux RND transporter periplasmic adaptor subunit [Chloroflexota bacterium]